MLHVGTNPQLLIGVGVAQPVLSLNVIGLLLLRLEGRCDERERSLCPEVSCESERAEECAEDIFLLSVKIYFKRLHILHRAKVSLSV